MYIGKCKMDNKMLNNKKRKMRLDKCYLKLETGNFKRKQKMYDRYWIIDNG